MPFEAIRNGVHVGISRDYLDHISRQTGIRFTLIETRSWKESIRHFESGLCAFLTFSSERRAFSFDTAHSSTYFRTPYVFVSKDRGVTITSLLGNGEKTFAVSGSNMFAKFAETYTKQIELLVLSGEAEALDAVQTETADIAVVSLLGANTFTTSERIDDLYISGFAEYVDGFRLVTRSDKAYLINSINDALSNVSEIQEAEIFRRWYQATPSEHRENKWFFPIILTVTVALIMTTWVTLNQRKITREFKFRDQEIERLQALLIDKNRTIEFLSTHDESTKLNNRNFMLQKVEEEINRFNRFRTQASLMLVNIEPLHSQTYQSGEIDSESNLKRLAGIILDKTREVDVSSRWSNDEILILCPQTNLASAQILAERILNGVELQSLQYFSDVKISLGVVCLNEGEDFAGWFDRATSAVVSAKRQVSHGYSTI